MKFSPLQDRLLVVRVDAEETTQGGIIVPDTAQEKPQEGRVVAVGPGSRLEDGSLRPLDVSSGDQVLFGKYAGTEIKIDGDQHTIMRESELLGVLEA